MKKSAKNSTFDEYRKACKYFKPRLYGSEGICSRSFLPCDEIVKSEEICSRMEHWNKIHNSKMKYNKIIHVSIDFVVDVPACLLNSELKNFLLDGLKETAAFIHFNSDKVQMKFKEQIDDGEQTQSVDKELSK